MQHKQAEYYDSYHKDSPEHWQSIQYAKKLSHHYHIDWNSHTRTYLKRRYEGTEFSMHLDWENWTYKAVKVRNKTICVVT